MLGEIRLFGYPPLRENPRTQLAFSPYTISFSTTRFPRISAPKSNFSWVFGTWEVCLGLMKRIPNRDKFSVPGIARLPADSQKLWRRGSAGAVSGCRQGVNSNNLISPYWCTDLILRRTSFDRYIFGQGMESLERMTYRYGAFLDTSQTP